MREFRSSQLARICHLGLLAALIFLVTSPLFASLGEDVSSIRSDQAQLKASVRVVPGSHYSVHEMQTPSGTVIRQFVSPAGTVFAVTWRGFPANLEQLLGSYFGEYVQAASRQTASRGRSVHIDNGNLVVDSAGHMRSVVGRAFLRQKIPSGVSGDEIH